MIGVLLMVILTLVFTVVIAAGLPAFTQAVDERDREFDAGFATMAGNPWSGEPGDLVRVSNPRAGAVNVTYRVNFTIESGSDTIGNSLNSVYLEVTTGSPDMFSNTDQSDLIQVLIDVDSDGTIDQDITGDVNGWDVQNGGTAVKVEFTGSAYTPSADDSVVVDFDGVKNPDDPGTYEMRAQTSGDGNWHYGNVTIVD